MFYVDGHISIYDIFLDVRYHHVGLQFAARKSEIFADGQYTVTEEGFRNWFEGVTHEGITLATMQIWDAFQDVDHFDILLFNGNTIKASARLMAYDDAASPTGWYVDLGVGTVGSGSRIRNVGNEVVASYSEAHEVGNFEPTLNDVEQRLYGPFFRCPVMVKTKFISALMKAIQQEAYIQPEGDVVGDIVALFDADPTLTKKVAKQYFGSAMKVLEFNAVWEAAAKRRPGLSKPGPRPAK